MPPSCVFDLPPLSCRSRSVGQYDKSAGNKTPTRPRCRFSFLAFSPVLCPCSSFSSHTARLAPPPSAPFPPLLFHSSCLPHSLTPYLSLTFSLSFSLFLTKLPLVCAYASSLYGSRPLVQQRIINYSPLRCACTRIFEKTARLTIRALPTKY